MLEKFLKNILTKKERGLPVMYIIYQPQNPTPNVVTHHIHPDLRQDEELNILLQKVADRVRIFYQNNPELLSEILKAVTK